MSTLEGIRKRVWTTGDKLDPRDIAEAFRDTDQQLRQIYRRELKQGTWLYSPPFYFEYPRVPSAVVLVSIRVSKQQPSVIDAGMVAWDYAAPRIKIVGIAGAGMVLGTNYEMTFEVIG